MENVKILPMDANDLSYLKNHLYSDFDDFWSFSILEQEFYNSDTSYLVAKYNSEIIGFAGIHIIIDEADIMNIVTKKDKRNLGIGSILLKSIIDISKNKKLTSITLEVNEYNTYAIKLYEKFKFNKVGIRKKYYNNTDSAIIMTLYI